MGGANALGDSREPPVDDTADSPSGKCLMSPLVGPRGKAAPLQASRSRQSGNTLTIRIAPGIPGIVNSKGTSPYTYILKWIRICCD